MVNVSTWQSLKSSLDQQSVKLVAVSKTKPVEDIIALYDLGQRDFGENYVQELVQKVDLLPKDICWHFIGHLQSNKVKYIAPFVHMIHAVDSLKLLQEINKQAKIQQRKINVLLQLFIAKEESKFGLDENELVEIINHYCNNRTLYEHVCISGLMGMASFSDNQEQIFSEFNQLHQFYIQCKQQYFHNTEAFNTCSMGMSGDYELAIQSGSNLVRIGSLLFGARN